MADTVHTEVEVIRAQTLDGVRHGFLGRAGGVSQGEVAGLNVGLGAGDEPAAVAENRRRARDAVAPDAQLVTLYQVHSADCVVVSEPWDEGERPQADALVTDRPGLLLGILTADCAPVLFADTEQRVIGAAHAGWKGAIGGVIESTVAAMERLGARRTQIRAAVGPCIAQASYEVDDAFRERFCTHDPANTACFNPGKPRHWQFNLQGFVAGQLANAGLSRFEALPLDTYAAPDRFFSFRRSCHRSEASYGRQISLIALD
ncbi:peptidoglycan editing factor PgeF [Novosphingobium sp. M1R2S20]|uniref:Purine nucleoside phosphorylase n=1 Tax=Novosphingobium rhizovicinum TaxID=3228928 RepID=A0ABV3R9P5_9SPHN